MNILDRMKMKRPEVTEPAPDDAAAAYDRWLASLPEEIHYWRDYIANDGANYPGDFAWRLRSDTQVSDCDPRMSARISGLRASSINLLDVGSGPLTNIGKSVPGKTLKITACDPLAHVYGKFLSEKGAKPPVVTQFADAENLSMFFQQQTFDVVHAANAIDHSYDPVAAIVQMLLVVNETGFVHLGHFENEAEAEEYTGLHQWNFSEKGGDFIIWNQGRNVSMRSVLGDAAFVDVERIPTGRGQDWILVTIRKTAKFASLEAGFRTMNLTRKYEQLLWRTQREAIA